MALDEAGGSGSTAEETLPSRPGFFGKLQGRKRGAARELPPPAGLAGGRSKHFLLGSAGTSVIRGGAGGLVPSRKGGGVQRDQNCWALPFKDKCVSAFSLLEETIR